MSYLLAVGDSWTDDNYKSHQPNIDCTFPKWPSILGDTLGLSKVINLGLAGGSNTYIFNQCYDQIFKEKPELVCVLLSEWDRREIFTYQYNNTLNLHAQTQRRGIDLRDFHWSEWLEDYCEKEKIVVNFSEYLWENWATLESVMDSSLRELLLFKFFCESNNIKYLVVQGTYPIDSLHIKHTNPADTRLTEIHNYLKYLLLSPYLDKLNKPNILGWPFFWEIGGSSMHRKFDTMNNPKIWLHEKDHHPSTLGHQEIADYFYKGYTNVYKQKN